MNGSTDGIGIDHKPDGVNSHSRQMLAKIPRHETLSRWSSVYLGTSVLVVASPERELR